MVKWDALIEAPMGVLMLYVSLALYEPLQTPLFGLLNNSAAFPYGSTTKVIIQLIPLILGVMLLYMSYKSFREPDTPTYYPIAR